MLHNRQKWHKPCCNLKNGDLVMVTSRNSNHGDWPLGLIIDMVVSNDGLVREVTVKSSKGILGRNIRNLCLLEECG